MALQQHNSLFTYKFSILTLLCNVHKLRTSTGCGKSTTLLMTVTASLGHSITLCAALELCQWHLYCIQRVRNWLFLHTGDLQHYVSIYCHASFNYKQYLYKTSTFIHASWAFSLFLWVVHMDRFHCMTTTLKTCCCLVLNLWKKSLNDQIVAWFIGLSSTKCSLMIWRLQVLTPVSLNLGVRSPTSSKNKIKTCCWQVLNF